MKLPAALVTGGAGSLGRVIVSQLLRDRDVVVLDSVEPRAIEGVSYRQVDLRDARAVESAVLAAAANVGDLLAVVNCAGVGPSYNRALDLDQEVMGRAMEINVLGAVNACRATEGMMRSKGWGRIVNISSVTATGGWAGRSEYAASKAALQSWSQSLAVELGSFGITVNCVAPGHLHTDMTEGQAIPWGQIVARTALGRLVTREEVASAVAFLLDERASGITGSVVRVDAGYLANELAK